MRRLSPLVVSVAAACSGGPGEDYRLQLDLIVPEGHDPLGAGELSLWIDDAQGLEVRELGPGSGTTWEQVDVGALDAARLGLLWSTPGAPLDPLALGDVAAWGQSAPVSIDAGELAVPVLVGEQGRLGTYGELSVDRAVIGTAAVALPDGDVLLFGGSGPSTWSDLDAGGGTVVARLRRGEAGLEVAADADMPRFTSTARDEWDRTAATATLLPDGLVLVAGGRGSWLPTTGPLGISFLWDPEARAAVWDGVLPDDNGRSQHVAVLRDDEVWLLGGITGADNGLAATFHVDVFDVPTRTWSKGPDVLNVGPVGFGHAVLPSGDLVVCGGGSQQPGLNDLLVPEVGCSLLPADRSPPRALAPLPDGVRMGHAMLTLADGTVLLGGGTHATTVFGVPGSETGPAVASAWILDVADETWSPLPDMETARAHHALVPLPDGRVLLVGGVDAAAGMPPRTVGAPVACPEVFDPGVPSFTAAPACEAAGAGAWPAVAAAPGYGVFVLAGADASGTGGRSWGLVTTGPSAAAP